MPTPTYVSLGTITLASTDSEIVFSSIPATYRDLIVIIQATGSARIEPKFRINGDTGSNYSWVRMTGTGSATASSAGTFSYGVLSQAGQLETSTPTNIIFQLMDYSATDKHKTILSSFDNAADAVEKFANRWANTSAVTSLAFNFDVAGSYASGSTFSLYGIAA
jgi:hypothetical protein